MIGVLVVSLLQGERLEKSVTHIVPHEPSREINTSKSSCLAKKGDRRCVSKSGKPKYYPTNQHDSKAHLDQTTAKHKNRTSMGIFMEAGRSTRLVLYVAAPSSQLASTQSSKGSHSSIVLCCMSKPYMRTWLVVSLI